MDTKPIIRQNVINNKFEFINHLVDFGVIESVFFEKCKEWNLPLTERTIQQSNNEVETDKEVLSTRLKSCFESVKLMCSDVRKPAHVFYSPFMRVAKANFLDDTFIIKIKTIGSRQDIENHHKDKFIGEIDFGKKFSDKTPIYQIEIIDDQNAYAYFTVGNINIICIVKNGN